MPEQGTRGRTRGSGRRQWAVLAVGGVVAVAVVALVLATVTGPDGGGRGGAGTDRPVAGRESAAAAFPGGLARQPEQDNQAARRAAELGITAYNVLEGFEGDADENGHRNRCGGWRFRGLPWRQG